MVGDRDIDIEVDGGITVETAPLLLLPERTCWCRLGRFGGRDPARYAENIAAIRDAASDAVS